MHFWGLQIFRNWWKMSPECLFSPTNSPNQLKDRLTTSRRRIWYWKFLCLNKYVLETKQEHERVRKMFLYRCHPFQPASWQNTFLFTCLSFGDTSKQGECWIFNDRNWRSSPGIHFVVTSWVYMNSQCEPDLFWVPFWSLCDAWIIHHIDVACRRSRWKHLPQPDNLNEMQTVNIF